MTNEEKAKAYDEALERASIAYKDEDRHLKATLERIFPELKEESEDERTRKEIISVVEQYVKMCERESAPCNTEDIDKWFAWLEKRGKIVDEYEDRLDRCACESFDKGYKAALEKAGEQNKINSCKFTCEDILALECSMNLAKITEGGEQLYQILVPLYDKIHNAYLLQLQGEQKSDDKVEPKFNVGDFIVSDYCMGKVIELTDDAYLLDSGQGIPFSCEHKAHIWTIQDAKEGDVLAFDDDNIVIFKDLYNSSTFHSYCHIEDGTFDFNFDWWNGEGFKPATQKQRDLLYQKMKDAGYEWDSEKKKLKIID